MCHVTFDPGLGTGLTGAVIVVLQAAVGVLEEGLGSAARQGAGFEECLFLLLVLVDKLHHVDAAAGATAAPVLVALILPLQAVQYAAYL